MTMKVEVVEIDTLWVVDGREEYAVEVRDGSGDLVLATSVDW